MPFFSIFSRKNAPFLLKKTEKKHPSGVARRRNRARPAALPRRHGPGDAVTTCLTTAWRPFGGSRRLLRRLRGPLFDGSRRLLRRLPATLAAAPGDSCGGSVIPCLTVPGDTCGDVSEWPKLFPQKSFTLIYTKYTENKVLFSVL